MTILIARCHRFLRELHSHSLRKLVIAVVGGSVVLAGIAMLVLPGPAFLVIPMGLAILATEFPWARRWLRTLRAVIEQKDKLSPPLAKTAGKVWHQIPAEEVVRFFGVDASTGLSGEDLRRRRKECGPNRVSARRGTPAWVKFFRQFNQPLVYILLLAVGVTAFLGEWVDSSVIFGVVFINAIVGFFQEAKAEKAIEALAKMLATETTVRRDGHKSRVDSGELVPGDVVLLQSGDRVPADLRFIYAISTPTNPPSPANRFPWRNEGWSSAGFPQSKRSAAPP